MTPEAMAALHAGCFSDAPRPWSAGEFAAMLALPGTLVVVKAAGFALGRAAGGEAELLTLAVAGPARRRGLGRTLVADFEREATARGATAAFLEVAESNAPARALYAGLGYQLVGRRTGYYARQCGPAITALVLRKPLFSLDEKA